MFDRLKLRLGLVVFLAWIWLVLAFKVPRQVFSRR